MDGSFVTTMNMTNVGSCVNNIDFVYLFSCYNNILSIHALEIMSHQNTLESFFSML
jgi:hypothetical protein